jgi:hypothetical protein
MKKRRKNKPRKKYVDKTAGRKKLRAVQLMEANFLKDGNATFAVTTNLLRNFVVRDTAPVNASFDKHYGSMLAETDGLFSEAAYLFFVATRVDTGLHDDYRSVLTGLVNSALNTFGASVIVLRNGLPGQSMILIRQVIEICSTIIHIVSDPTGRAIKDFQEGKYASTASIGPAKKAVPIMGMFWGFLSKTFVHINQSHSEIRSVRPYKTNNADVGDVLSCLRMAVWICYITTELAFPTARESNRYWKRRALEGKNAVAYEPDEKEREWAAKFLNLKEIASDELGDVEADEMPE